MSGKTNFQPSELLNMYKESSFPRTKIPKDVFVHQDILFNKTPDLPKLSQDAFKDALSFLIREEKFKKGFSNNNQTSNYNNNSNTNQNFIKPWKKGDDENMDFFDNFKGKFNPNDVNNFKRNAEMGMTKAINIQYQSNSLIDFNEDPSKLQSNKKSGGKDGHLVSVDDFFDETDKGGDKFTEIREEVVKYVKSTTYLNLSIEDCITLVAERLIINNDDPLWYVFHEDAESSFGPLSSKQIIKMLSMKLLDLGSKIRLIDVFVFNGCKQFDFFTIRDIQLDNFVDNISVSPLAQNNGIKKPSSIISKNTYGGYPQNKSLSSKDQLSKTSDLQNQRPQVQPQTIYSSNSASIYDDFGNAKKINSSSNVTISKETSKNNVNSVKMMSETEFNNNRNYINNNFDNSNNQDDEGNYYQNNNSNYRSNYYDNSYNNKDDYGYNNNNYKQGGGQGKQGYKNNRGTNNYGGGKSLY